MSNEVKELRGWLKSGKLNKEKRLMLQYEVGELTITEYSRILGRIRGTRAATIA